MHYQFPGGAYKTPPTIFQLLEDEGLIIPDHLKIFPYRATFDFKCMFTAETELNNTEKLMCNSKHIALSGSVCSTVPDYDQPKCFVSDGSSGRRHWATQRMKGCRRRAIVLGYCSQI